MVIDTLQDFRDVTIISFPIAGTVLFLIAIILTIVIGGLSVATLRKVRSVLGESVQPTLENVRETTENVRGTVAFISDYAVTPVVRTYGIFAGARRFIVGVSRFTRRAGDGRRKFDAIHHRPAPGARAGVRGYSRADVRQEPPPRGRRG